ncbi:DNA topoisomerase [Rhodohalobacter sp. 8-1]|uniref:DNA topoisomerase n=1 Tax=Rhodohalobacter sp. 8-1 TaxID=3131972 RepID=UPI0030ED2F1B
MSEAAAEYTLLIVESPTLAARLQDIAPDHIFVFATEGFLWKPQYNAAKGILGKKAVPDKLDLRNELRREAKSAVKIVVATDSDPSGDFIAWTIHKELKTERILRGHLRSISRSAISQLIRDASNIDFSTLHKRLENRFKIRSIWFDVFPQVSMKSAGLLALLEEAIWITDFTTDSGQVLRSNRPLEMTLRGQHIKLVRSSETGWIHHSPLSTFEVVAHIHRSWGSGSFSAAQALLQKTFEAKNPVTGEALITYPRTGNRSFFPGTWLELQQKWTTKRSLNSFKPVSLRNETPANEAHDAIRPVTLDLSPDWVLTHMPSDIGKVYRLIYSKTLSCIKMPKQSEATFQHEKSGALFMTPSPMNNSRITVYPYLSVSELCYQLCKLGVLRPSGFGHFIDEAIKSEKITVDEQDRVYPGPDLTSAVKPRPTFSVILTKLRTVADHPTLSDETIRQILSS